MLSKEKFENILVAYSELEKELSSNPDSRRIAELSKKFSEMTPLVEKIKKYGFAESKVPKEVYYAISNFCRSSKTGPLAISQGVWVRTTAWSSHRT